MYVSKVKNKYIKHRKARIAQGDILRDISFLVGAESKNSTASLDSIELQYAVVMNQDCDLNSDYLSEQDSNGKGSSSIPSILLCPAYPAEQFFKGEHIAEWNLQKMNGKLPDKIRKNDELKRYHYIASDTELNIPELVIDFKHFYTIPRDTIYEIRKSSYIATISELYREELSQRFANFLARIGLPEGV